MRVPYYLSIFRTPHEEVTVAYCKDALGGGGIMGTSQYLIGAAWRESPNDGRYCMPSRREGAKDRARTIDERGRPRCDLYSPTSWSLRMKRGRQVDLWGSQKWNVSIVDVYGSQVAEGSGCVCTLPASSSPRCQPVT
jgi:hypothetical protein